MKMLVLVRSILGASLIAAASLTWASPVAAPVGSASHPAVGIYLLHPKSELASVSRAAFSPQEAQFNAAILNELAKTKPNIDLKYATVTQAVTPKSKKRVLVITIGVNHYKVSPRLTAKVMRSAEAAIKAAPAASKK